MLPGQEFLTLAEAAKYLGYSVSRLRVLARAGIVEKRQLVKCGKVLISASSLEKLLERRRPASLHNGS